MNPSFFLFFLFFFYLPILTSSLVNLSDYDYPHPSDSDDFETIAILGTNDIHGHILPTPIYLSKNATVQTGGVTLLSSYIKPFLKEWSSSFLWLDSGDQYQGTMESNLFSGEPIVRFFNFFNHSSKIYASIGNHDFDFGIQNMTKQFSMSNFEHISSNIFKKEDDELWNFTNTKETKIINVGKVKVGVLGLSTVFTPETTATNVSNLIFKDYKEIAIEKSTALRENGAQIILLTCHVGMFCLNGEKKDGEKLGLRGQSTAQKTYCNEQDELYKFLGSLPDGTVDGVVGGHQHTIVHHWKGEVPVILGGSNAKYFNVIYLKYDLKNNKLIKNETLIEGPVPVCEYLINDQKTCYLEDEKTDNATLNSFSFHGEEIKEDLELKTSLNKYIEEAEKYRKTVLGFVEQKMVIDPYKLNKK